MELLVLLAIVGFALFAKKITAAERPAGEEPGETPAQISSSDEPSINVAAVVGGAALLNEAASQYEESGSYIGESAGVGTGMVLAGLGASAGWAWGVGAVVYVAGEIVEWRQRVEYKGEIRTDALWTGEVFPDEIARFAAQGATWEQVKEAFGLYYQEYREWVPGGLKESTDVCRALGIPLTYAEITDAAVGATMAAGQAKPDGYVVQESRQFYETSSLSAWLVTNAADIVLLGLSPLDVEWSPTRGFFMPALDAALVARVRTRAAEAVARVTAQQLADRYSALLETLGQVRDPAQYALITAELKQIEATW